jgi:hypothetical protein
LYIKTIDIAHPPLSSEAAEKLLEDEIRQVRNSQELRALKVIHGYGSSAGRSVLKEVVRNWSYRNRKHLLAVITGEEYNITNAKTMKMRKECGQLPDPDLDSSNPGMTIIWVK